MEGRGTFQNTPTDDCCDLCSGQTQRFYVEPRDTAVIRGQDAVLLCSVVNLQGPLQWLKSGFGLGPGPVYDGYPRYRVVQRLPENGITICQTVPSA